MEQMIDWQFRALNPFVGRGLLRAEMRSEHFGSGDRIKNFGVAPQRA
jgi:hypothetical protein